MQVQDDARVGLALALEALEKCLGQSYLRTCTFGTHRSSPGEKYLYLALTAPPNG